MSVRFNPLKRPETPPKISWFEFLLCPSMLEEHLCKESPEPSACELIALFLYQAELAMVTEKEIAKNTEDGEKKEESENLESGSKKVTALKSLALRVASFLNWNLDKLEKGLALGIMENILVELLAATLPGVEPIAKRHASLDLQALTPEAIFSVLLYHRWCLRTAIKDTFPVKPSKVANVQVPGLLDPNVQSACKKENIMHNIHDGLNDSVVVLEHYMEILPHVILPVLACFNVVTEKNDSDEHDWTVALDIPSKEMRCQLSYELGSQYFNLQQYEKCYEMFLTVRKLMPDIEDAVLCDVDEGRLQGYCCALSGLLGRSIPGEVSEEARLMEAVESLRSDKFEGLTSVLLQDNQKCVLSLAYRMAIEEEVKNVTTSQTFILEIMSCNMVRQAMSACTSPSEYIQTLSRNPDHLEFLLEIAAGVLNTASEDHRTNLKYFFRYLCYALPKTMNTAKKVLESDLKVLFDASEADDMLHAWDEPDDAPFTTTSDKLFPDTSEEDCSISQMEHDLLISNEPNTIRQLVQKLLPKIGKYQTMYLSDRWKSSVPREIHNSIENLPVQRQSFIVYTHIMVAKAILACQMQMFSEARNLLHTSDQGIKDISYKLSKQLRGEILRVDLQQCHQTNTFPDSSNQMETSKRCKTFVSSLQVEHDLVLVNGMTEAVMTYLLNAREWEFVANLNLKISGCIELAKQVASLCKELPQQQKARKFARELMESVTLIFTSSNQQKRTGSGMNTNINRDSSLGLVSQQQFLGFCMKLKDPIVLGVIISLLTKLYNILKDDLTVEISSEYITLWPTTLGNMNSINVANMTEAVTTVMTHSLHQHPSHPSWLRTQADLDYANGHYSQSMRHYLQLGIVTSDYFTKPITKAIFDENIYRRMIRCCNYLQCHTQIAVLCQFLEEVDYATAFKALQEKNVHDAMDSYYECFWDVTILEFLVHHHHKKGELDRKQTAVNLLGQLELNSSNPAEITFEATKVRKAKFLRILAKEYIQNFLCC